MSLTSRERVLTALNHKEPDRIPFILGTGLSTAIMRGTYRRVKKLLDVEEKQEQYMYGTWKDLGAARIDETVLKKLGSDARGVWDRKPHYVEERNIKRESNEPYVDDFHVGHVKTDQEEVFPQIHPLQESTLEALEKFPWPNMGDPTRFTGVRERAAQLAKDNEYAVFASPWLLFPFERACQLQGMEDFLFNMAIKPDFAKELLQQLTNLYKEHLKHFLNELGGNADIITIGDDLGSQEQLLISPNMYREILKPFHAELISFIKKHSNLKILFHSDGDVFDIIKDLIEIGVDILNPIQTSAGKMSDLHGLKTQYGNHLTFCGAIDTQSILARGTPAKIHAEVQRVSKILGTGGGYMLASVHAITNDVPAENVLALSNAVMEHTQYPLK